MKQKAKPSPLLRVISSRWAVFVILAFVGALFAYWYYPNYLAYPNFYGEDGTLFAQNIITKGLAAALFTPFNGYLIVGLYLLEGAAFVLNLFFGGAVSSLPVALALVSYAFWGSVCALPVLLFWRELPQKRWLLLISLTLALLPLPSFQYAIIGTIGNFKFAFTFIAFLLLLKRHWLPEGSKWFYGIDAALVLCAFTNMTTVFLLPFALLRYWPGRKGIKASWLQSLLRTKSFISLVVMGVVILAEVLIMVKLGGLDSTNGYMSEPFETAKTIEIFVYRTLLFPFAYPIWWALNNLSVLLLLGVVLAGTFTIARKEDRVVIVFAIYSALIATTLFVSQRSGVSIFFVKYTSSGPDQFFYPQNWIFLFAILFVLARGLFGRAARAKKIAAILVLVCLPLSLAVVDRLHHPSLQREQQTGSFQQHIQEQCSGTNGSTVHVLVYPIEAHSYMTFKRSLVCK
jgi:hypothetical protein